MLCYLFSHVEPSSSLMDIVAVQVSTYEVNIFYCVKHYVTGHRLAVILRQSRGSQGFVRRIKVLFNKNS
jgi:hypothetical protein